MAMAAAFAVRGRGAALTGRARLTAVLAGGLALATAVLAGGFALATGSGPFGRGYGTARGRAGCGSVTAGASFVFGEHALLQSFGALLVLVELLVVAHVVSDVGGRLVLLFDVVFFVTNFRTHCRHELPSFSRLFFSNDFSLYRLILPCDFDGAFPNNKNSADLPEACGIDFWEIHGNFEN